MERNVPKLRFKGFNDEWKEKKLGEITTLTDGVHFTPDYVESGVPFWSVETIVSGVKPKYITKKAHELAIKRCQPRKNDILITRIGTLAKSKVVEDNSDFSIYVSVALVKSAKEFNSYYLKQYFDTKYYYKEFLSKSLLTATPKKINMEDLKATKVKLPLLQEQERIANFLTKVDKIIEKQDEKVKNLEKYKKGMMQKIFSQEIRFKDENGEEFPEWEEKKLGDLAKITTGNCNVDDSVVNGKYRFFDRGIESVKFLNEYFLDSEAIIYPGEGSSFLPRYYKGKFALHQRCYAIYNFNISIDIKYIFYYMQLLNNYFLRQAVGTTVPSLRQDNFNKCNIMLPCFYEQQKIVNVLINIDNILDKENSKLEELKQWKRGLLQQMFV